MYFSNIANEEFQCFHNTVRADFSMSLTDILNSKLFKSEEIIENKIYRVYPLFYCDKIISSNGDDKILDNKCLILHKIDEHETYLSFISKGLNNIVLNEDILNIKDIKDYLSIPEFNSLIYRLRKKEIIESSLNFKKNEEYIEDFTLSLKSSFKNNSLYRMILNGKITTENNEALANKALQIYRWTNEGWSYVNTVTTNKNGEYTYTDNSVLHFSDNSSIGSRLELQSIIDDAINNGIEEISLTKQYRITDRIPLNIPSSLKINGNGHIISGNNYSQIFNISGDNVIIDNIILTNGNFNGNGAGISWSGNNGVLSNSLIVDCIANNNGGGVYWTGDNGNITSCRFVNNAVNGNGGAMYLESHNFKAFDISCYGNFCNGTGACLVSYGDYNTFDLFNVERNVANGIDSGGSKGIIVLNGDYNTFKNSNLTSNSFNEYYSDKSSRAVNNEFKYKIRLSPAWYSYPDNNIVENAYNISTHLNNSFLGVLSRIMTIKGVYGSYNLSNVYNQLQNDLGFIINDKIKENPITLKLNNPFFLNAKYLLTFRVSNLTGVNVFDSDKNDYKTEDTFSVVLVEENEVALDLSDYANDSILDFNVDVKISFDVPEIVRD